MTDPESEVPLTSARDERVREICALLIANGYVPVTEFRDLLLDEPLRVAVQARLGSVGLTLVHNVYSEYWGVGLTPETAADERLAWSNNFGLERGALALLLILWCKLVLPKRLAQEERQPQDGSVAALFPEIEQLPQPQVSVKREQIIAEFGEVLGGITATHKYLAQLARAKLIRSHGGTIEEGPLLSLVVDETKLSDELRREVLLGVLEREHQVRTAAAAAAAPKTAAAPAAPAAVPAAEPVTAPAAPAADAPAAPAAVPPSPPEPNPQ